MPILRPCDDAHVAVLLPGEECGEWEPVGLNDWSASGAAVTD